MKIRHVLYSLLVPALACAAALPACSGAQNPASDSARSSSGGVAPGTGTIATRGLSESQKLLQQTQATCPEASECPEAVAVLAVAYDDAVDLCTAFLVAPDVVATTARCVPARIRSGEVTCQQRMRVVFPSAGNLASTAADCAQVIDSSRPGENDDGRGSQDYAFVRLDRPVARRPLAINEDGLQDSTTLTVAKVGSISDVVPYGEVRTQRCKVVQNSIALPGFRDKASPIATLGDCPIVDTNDGAPAFDDHQEVRAVVHAAFSGRDRYQSAFQSMLQDPISDLAFATNFACVHTPFESAPRALPAACEAQPPVAAGLTGGVPSVHGIVSPAISAQAGHKLDEQFQGWASAHSDRFKWKQDRLDGAENGATVKPKPDCINQPNSWLDQYHHWYLVFVGGYEADTSSDIDIPVWDSAFSLNPYLQLGFSVENASVIHATLSFKPRDIHNGGQSRVTLVSKPGPGQIAQTLFDGVIKTCR